MRNKTAEIRLGSRWLAAFVMLVAAIAFPGAASAARAPSMFLTATIADYWTPEAFAGFEAYTWGDEAPRLVLAQATEIEPTTPADTGTVQQVEPQPPASADPVVPDVQPPATSVYILGPGDRVRITVFGEADLSGDFVIDSTGSVALPLLGQTTASGLGVDAFEDLVERRLKERRILNAPSVTAQVLNFRPFYILGEVAKPGTYPYTSGLDVYGAVATAGGFTPLANQYRAMIKRSGESQENAYPLVDIVPVLPGDTIRIVKGSIYILGEVNKPGEYPFSSGMTLMSAVATAGGYSYRANQRRVFILRENESEEVRYNATPSLPIQPGDTIRVPERFF